VLAILLFPHKLRCVGFGDGVLNRASEANKPALSAIAVEGVLRVVTGGKSLGFNVSLRD